MSEPAADKKKPEPTPEDLAEVIRRIGESFDRLLKSGLNRRAIVTLIWDDSKVGKRDIQAVLLSLATLEKTYTVKK